MLLWKVLVEAAEAEKIDRDSDRAHQWVRQRLPELLQPYTDERGGHGAIELFDWPKEWPIWEKNFLALMWLAKAKAMRRGPGKRGLRIPRVVQQVLDGVVARTRNMISSDFLSEARISLQVTNRDGAIASFNVNRRFDDLETFWQCVFVSFFNPDALLAGSFCARCGKPLKATQKLRKPTRAKLCNACRVYQWRRDHPEEAREMWRESKRQERARLQLGSTSKRRG